MLNTVLDEWDSEAVSAIYWLAPRNPGDGVVVQHVDHGMGEHSTGLLLGESTKVFEPERPCFYMRVGHGKTGEGCVLKTVSIWLVPFTFPVLSN